MARLSVLHLLLLLLFILPGTAQHAWPVEKGGLHLSVSEWWIVANKHYDADGNVQDNVAEYGYYASQLDFQYGLTNRWSGNVHFPFANYVYTKLPLAGTKEDGWKSGDAEVGLEYAILQDTSTRLSSQLMIGLPLSGMVGSQSTGDQDWYQQVSLTFLRRIIFFKRSGWWNIGAGYRNRTSHFENELHYHLGIGVDVDADFTAILAVKGLRRTGDQSAPAGVFSESLFSNRREAACISPEIRFNVDERFSIGVGIDAIVGGKNHFSGTAYSVSISGRLN